MNKVKYVVTLPDGATVEPETAEINGGTCQCFYEGGREAWLAAGQWLRVNVVPVDTDAYEASVRVKPSTTLAPATYVGSLRSYVGSGNPVIEIDGEDHEFKSDMVHGELEDKALVEVDSELQVKITPIQQPQAREAPKWWELPKVHEVVFVGLAGTDVVLSKDGISSFFPATILMDGPPKSGSKVQVMVNEDLSVEEVDVPFEVG